MRKLGVSCCFIILCILVVFQNVHAWPWDAEKLAAINGTAFTTDDFKNWWINWKDKDSQFPESPEPFVNWCLLVQEAEQMELYNEPEYRHKINVFLKARTLLLYKGDMINSRIKISDQELKDRYAEYYLPRLQLLLLYFNDKKIAQKSYELLKNKKIDFSEFRETSCGIDKSSFFYEEKCIRVRQLPSEWQSVVASLSVESMSVPIRWRKGFVIIYLKERGGFDPADFDQLKPAITNEIRDKKEQELTVELIRRLKTKYRVQINEEIFAALDLDSADEALLEKTLFSIDGVDYTARMFLHLANKELRFRKQYGFDIGEKEKLKKRLLEVILAQTLTTKAALEEHYEKKEPLKPLYNFYTRHRLIRELEKRVFRPEVHVDERDILKYYQQNLDRFSQPEMVSIAVVEDDEELIDRIFEDMKRGADLVDAASHFYAGEVPVKNMQYNLLDQLVQKVVDSLAIGQASAPFVVNGHNTIIKLLKRTPVTPVPLEQLHEEIAELVEEEQFSRIRANYLADLKNRSVIEVNQNAWEELQKQFEEVYAVQ